MVQVVNDTPEAIALELSMHPNAVAIEKGKDGRVASGGLATNTGNVSGKALKDAMDRMVHHLDGMNDLSWFIAQGRVRDTVHFGRLKPYDPRKFAPVQKALARETEALCGYLPRKGWWTEVKMHPRVFLENRLFMQHHVVFREKKLCGNCAKTFRAHLRRLRNGREEQ